jgi:acyl-CoA hydrolase
LFPPWKKVRFYLFISTARNDVGFIVTGYCVAEMLGKSMRQRAEQLISIAHPDFRAGLRKEAEKLFFI